MCFDLWTGIESVSRWQGGMTALQQRERPKEMNESLRAIGRPLTPLSVFVLSEIHTGLCWDNFAELIAADNGQMKSKRG